MLLNLVGKISLTSRSNRQVSIWLSNYDTHYCPKMLYGGILINADLGGNLRGRVFDYSKFILLANQIFRTTHQPKLRLNLGGYLGGRIVCRQTWLEKSPLLQVLTSL